MRAHETTPSDRVDIVSVFESLHSFEEVEEDMGRFGDALFVS